MLQDSASLRLLGELTNIRSTLLFQTDAWSQQTDLKRWPKVQLEPIQRPCKNSNIFAARQTMLIFLIDWNMYESSACDLTHIGASTLIWSKEIALLQQASQVELEKWSGIHVTFYAEMQAYNHYCYHHGPFLLTYTILLERHNGEEKSLFGAWHKVKPSLVYGFFTKLIFPVPASCCICKPEFSSSGLSATSTIFRSSICCWMLRLPSHIFLTHHSPASLRNGLESSTCKHFNSVLHFYSVGCFSWQDEGIP